MPVIRRTPSLYASGKYVLRTPFVANADRSYTCMAIRSFNDIYELKEDVFTKYYESNGLSDIIFNEDKEARVCIVTLMSEDAQVIYVPDSYIESYPDVSNVLYSRIILSVDLGALPDKLNLDFLNTQISNIVGDVIGVAAPGILVHKAPTTGFISAEAHADLEEARTAAITLIETDYAKVLQLQTQVDSQNQLIATMTDLLIDNGIIT